MACRAWPTPASAVVRPPWSHGRNCLQLAQIGGRRYFHAGQRLQSKASSLEAGVVGLPNVGKSTLFNALTAAGAAASNFPFCTIEPNTGFHTVFDPNLALISKYAKPQRQVPALVRVVDIAGIVQGASAGKGLGNKFLSHIREVDAILHVVRCFSGDSVTHVEGSVDCVRDAEVIETELLLKDAETVAKSLEKLSSRKKKDAAETGPGYKELLERCREALDQDMPIRTMLATLPADVDASAVKKMGLITAKPMLYVANVDDAQAADMAADRPVEAVDRLTQYAATHHASVCTVCAATEADLTEIDNVSERAEMMEMLGVTDTTRGVAHVGRAIYELLGLQSFYTAGETEVRAWPIVKGTTAQQAAGVIHSDFEKAFVRAEVYSVDDLVGCGSEKELRAQGRIRSEGKTYVMQQNDIVHFLCNC